MKNPEQLFVQVVEAGSFKRAAEQLNVEPSSLSRKVAALEARLNVKLLHRSTRRTRPTELGERYYAGLCKLIDEKTALEETISSGSETLTGNLRVSAPIDFGVEFVVPVLRDMQNQAPGLSVETLLGSGFLDLVEQGIDVAVRIGDLPDSNLIARKLGEIPRVLVASPQYLELHGHPETPDDLENHNFILYSATQGRSDIEFVDGVKHPHSSIRSNITVNSVRAIRSLVKDGVGIHLGPRWVFSEDFKFGAVTQVLPQYGLKSFPAHAVYTAKSYLPRKTKEFVERLSVFMEHWN